MKRDKNTLAMFKTLDKQYARAALSYPEKDVDPILVVRAMMMAQAEEEPDLYKRAHMRSWALNVFAEWVRAKHPLDVWAILLEDMGPGGDPSDRS